jgi:hypothetical protein
MGRGTGRGGSRGWRWCLNSRPGGRRKDAGMPGTAGRQGRRRGWLAAGSRRRQAENSPEHHRKRRSRATVRHSRRGLDREEEENGAKLTRCSMTAMERCRRRAVMRGGRDHGCPPGRGLRPQLRAFEGGDGVLEVL